MFFNVRILGPYVLQNIFKVSYVDFSELFKHEMFKKGVFTAIPMPLKNNKTNKKLFVGSLKNLSANSS